jgi:hypothetical protein
VLGVCVTAAIRPEEEEEEEEDMSLKPRLDQRSK